MAPRSTGLVVAVLLLLAIAGGAWWLWGTGGAAAKGDAPTWTVARGPLRVTVLEGGSLQSLKPEVISSEVEGEAKIISIVPEGTVITAEDVAAGKVLVELDSSDLRINLAKQKSETAQSQSAALQAAANLDIERKQGESDTRKAELEVRFAELDLDKYVGSELAKRLAEAKESRPDVAAILRDPALGGEALQNKRKKESEIALAREEVSRAKQKLDWTKKLFEKGYVSEEEQAADELALRRKEAEDDQARIALDLFFAYEATKEVEKRVSDLLEARENWLRAKAKAASAVAQAEADLYGKEESLRIAREQLKRLETQLASCIIRAQNPGIVVYASGDEWGRWGGNDQPIKEGAKVYERQPIISLPDTTSMGVRVNVHESAMDKVKLGQEAAVKVDAFPNLPLRGEVVKVATIPNAANRWMNPDLKVYTTEISIEDPPQTLRPGMSAKVEVLVEELPSVLTVPVQALTGPPGSPTVHVRGPEGEFAERRVETGPGNDRFVSVKTGVSEGDVVLLAPPRPTLAPSEPGAAREPRRGPGGGGGRPAGATPGGGSKERRPEAAGPKEEAPKGKGEKEAPAAEGAPKGDGKAPAAAPALGEATNAASGDRRG